MPQLVPFWNSDVSLEDPGALGGIDQVGAADPPLTGFNAVYQKNPWDTAWIRGVQVPGLVSVTPKRARHLWTIQAAGAPPVPIKAGYEPMKFTMKVTLWTPRQWELIQPIMWQLLPIWVKRELSAKDQKKLAKSSEDPNAAFDVSHPLLTAFSVSSCICEDMAMDGEGEIRKLTIQMLEYRRNKSAVATVNTSEVHDKFDPDKLANAETAAANGKVVKNHSTQGPQKKPSENVSLTPTTG